MVVNGMYYVVEIVVIIPSGIMIVVATFVDMCPIMQ